MKLWSFLLVISLLFGSSAIIAPCSTITSMEILIDCQQEQGRIHHFGDINCGPLHNHDVFNAIDLSDQYQSLGFNLIRTHDFSGPTDVSTIFPNFTKNPFDPSSYNFTQSDRYISAIKDMGGQVFFRMGESASTNEELRQPPRDIHKWAQVCQHILMHYNDGWADGYQYNISYVEIWNEPDLDGFFNGSCEQYYELYEVTANTLKTYDPSLKIGGPCTSSIFNTNFTTRFLSYVSDYDVPLDFYSWHMYADHPAQLYQASLFVRSLLDSYGFSETENINTEWNINLILPQRDKDNAKNAAFTACALSLMQDASMDHFFRYRGTGDDNWLTEFIGFDLSLLKTDGQYKTPTLVYKVFNMMADMAPLRLQTTPMNDDSGVSFLAGIAELHDHIGILLSNYEQERQEYMLTVKHIPWDSEFSVLIYLIDDNHDFKIIQQFSTKNQTLELRNVLETSMVQYIHLTNTTAIPEEGPEAYDISFMANLALLDPFRMFFAFALLMIFFG